MSFDLAAAIDEIGTRHTPTRSFVATGGRAIVTHTDHVGQLGFIMVSRSLRCRGIGSRLLADVGRWSDETGRSLYLLPQPIDRFGLDAEQLVVWYTARGWEPATLPGAGCSWMVRCPSPS